MASHLLVCQATFNGMKKSFLAIPLLRGGGIGFLSESYPDAVPNNHVPGEVDIEAVQFLRKSKIDSI
ncbi:MAG: hypothetical protein ABF379_10635 [Akkermansiaceae bacterium]|jgi:hypothetical protein